MAGRDGRGFSVGFALAYSGAEKFLGYALAYKKRFDGDLARHQPHDALSSQKRKAGRSVMLKHNLIS
jgi:hypothetical protein